MERHETIRYETAGGLAVDRWSEQVDPTERVESLIDQLDSHRGVILTSTFEYPGRYTRWDVGFVDPAIELRAQGRDMEIEAYGPRGAVLLAAMNSVVPVMREQGTVDTCHIEDGITRLTVCTPNSRFTEEERSRQPSVFSVLRALISFLRSDEDQTLGFYGAFGYDLAFQFDPVTLHHERDSTQRDLVLFIPDDVVVVDHKREVALRHRYDFSWGTLATDSTSQRQIVSRPFQPHARPGQRTQRPAGEYAKVVENAKAYFARGDLFEVTPSQVFAESIETPPSEIFRRLRSRNPAPYGALMNLGQDEYLISASPEMYVRCEGRRVETCPIAGTIERGADVLADADQIRLLLNSTKDDSELTMCTDVDRNDKSRVCDPESIRVIGRRQIEAYSRLFHTVDHIEGTLRPEFDALDAFLAHTWAVTVTGAPKLWAMRFIEEHEIGPRAWYGGAIGALLFNGNINTGLTLRTIHVRGSIASVRAGATLLMDSDPQAEEIETHTKSSALLDAIHNPISNLNKVSEHRDAVGHGVRILLVDHEDSFVHTLAGYLRRTGATVTTIRVPLGSRLDEANITAASPDLVVLSPGPGKPTDFDLTNTLAIAEHVGIPVFGVCLGLQGMVEHFGGTLGQLDYPMHGKASEVTATGEGIFRTLPERFSVGRYHSLFGRRETLPEVLEVTAQTDDGLVMAIEHRSLPFAAVQFHPESIMTLDDEIGMRLIENVIRRFCHQQTPT